MKLWRWRDPRDDKEIDKLYLRVRELERKVADMAVIKRDVNYPNGAGAWFTSGHPSDPWRQAYTFTPYPVTEVVEMILTHLKLDLATTSAVPAQKHLVKAEKK